MECYDCKHENRSSARFCERCGTKLQRICATCQNELRQTARFCDHCGTPVIGKEEIVATDFDRGNERRHEGERRHLTVMFCDLADSTKLSAQLDPEELRNVVRKYQELCAEVLQKFEGHIAQYLGDGILVYMGYPIAHENDAARAIKSGLAIIEALSDLNVILEVQYKINLSVRIGIHTGLVVIGEMGGGAQREWLAMGQTPNIAARLEGLAKNNSVVVSQNTYQLVQDAFESESMGEQLLKGVAEPMAVHHIIGERAVSNKFSSYNESGLMPLIGRAKESVLLWDKWTEAGSGQGNLILISGEAGIGKSRLTFELTHRVHQENAGFIVGWQCDPVHENSALYPAYDWLQHVVIQLRDEDTVAVKSQKIKAFLKAYELPEHTYEELLQRLFLPPRDASGWTLEKTPAQQKKEFIDLLIGILLHRPLNEAVLLHIEDVHWADPSTLELLSVIIEQVPTSRLLVVLTFRPAFKIPWDIQPFFSLLPLSRLSSEATAKIIARLNPDSAISEDMMAHIASKTDGIPLYVEEMTKMLAESGLLASEETGRTTEAFQ
ncbi:MAG: adenylate/guanylate cyclase domain-containing protein, partial [Rhodothermales bacterium]